MVLSYLLFCQAENFSVEQKVSGRPKKGMIKKYIYIYISKWIGTLRDLIYFALTYEYVSSLLLSSENIM